MQYLCARYYNPGTGTFLSRDPIRGFPGLSNSYNGFNYAYGNPINLADASGECPNDTRSIPGRIISNFCKDVETRLLQGLMDVFNPSSENSAFAYIEQEHPVGNIAAAVLFEPYDWAMTLSAWSRGDFHVLDLAGLLPFVPSAARRGAELLGAAR